MRLAIVSDVHANLPALRAVLARVDRAGVERIVCCGDVVGYGPHPNACVNELAERGIETVAGNHDLIALDRLPRPGRGSLARVTLDWTRRKLSDEARGWLERLPATLELPDGVVIAHGSLTSPSEYVRDRVRATLQLELLAQNHQDADTLVLGHTHLAMAFGLSGGLRRIRSTAAEPLALERPAVVNPGAVGQSRERKPVARYALLDTGDHSVVFHAISYDHAATRRALVECGLPTHAYHAKPRPIRRRLVAVRDRLTG
jgi:putative phosphoesterase